MIRTTLQALAFAAALAVAAVPAHAQPGTPAAPAASPAQLRAAERVLAAMQMKEMLPKLMDQMIGGMMEQGGEDMAQFEAVFREVMQEAMAWDVMRPLYIRVYTEVYTLEELESMAAFYESPVGQRIVLKMPDVTQRSMELMQERMQEVTPRMIERMMEVMEEGEKPAKPGKP